MAETVRCVLMITLTIAFFGSSQETVDSVPAAVTIYRNPEFYQNLTERNEEEEDDNSDHTNNSEEFYDFDDDEYRYPGEPKKPNPPAAPDFTTYFDESPEFQPEPREIYPPREGYHEEDHLRKTEENGRTIPSYYHNDNEDARGETEEEEATDYGGQDEEEKEANEGDSSTENDEDERNNNDMYNVPMDKDLEMNVPAKLYKQSTDYFNPILKYGMSAYNYPSAYDDLDSYEDDRHGRPYVDNKKGTREYLKDHSIEEVEDPGNARAGSKHIIRTVAKIGIKAFHPVFYVPHSHRIKKKYKILHKPKKLYKLLHYRELPDDSVYQLSSDYDTDFEFF